jgi:hypothetical protein
MHTFHTAVEISGVCFLAGLAAVLALNVANGRISTSGLLSVKGGPYDGELSPARLNTLLLTVAFAAYYLAGLMRTMPTEVPDVPQGWLVAIGAGHGAYLMAKFQSMLLAGRITGEKGDS